MKIKHYISAVMLTLVAAGFTACDGKDEPGYNGATKPAEEQRIFFTSSSMTENIDPDASSFDILLYRPQDENAPELTVQLQSFCPEEGILGTVIKVPQTATFAAGSPNATISVEYDAAGMAGNHPYPVSITVDEANADVYGIRTITVNVNRSAYTDWAPFGLDDSLGRTGLGSYTFTQYYSGTEDPVLVLERHVPDDPNDMEFQFQWLIDNDNPDLGYATFMTAYTKDGGKTIRVPEQKFADNANYGDVLVADTYTYTGSASYNGLSFFDSVTGQFTLNLYYYCSAGGFGNGDEFLNLVGYMDTNDYSISLSNKGQIELGGDYLVVGYSATSHVDFSAYTIVKSLMKEVDGEKVLDEDAYAEVVNGIAAQVLDPDNASTTYDINSVEGTSKNITVSFSSPGDYTMVAVAFHTDNAGVTEAKSDTYLDFYFDTFNPWDGWTTVTEDAVYTDNIVATMFGASNFANYQATVTVQKSDDYEGLYRIVNPFADFAQYGLDVADFGSIEFDASDPDHVYFPLSDTGILDGGDAMSLMSISYYFMLNGTAASELPEIYWGTYKDNKVTLPAFNGAASNSNFVAMFGNDGPYLCDADFTLEFSASAAKPGKIAKSLKNAISRNLTPLKGGMKPLKAYFKVNKVEAAPKAAARAKASKSPRRGIIK